MMTEEREKAIQELEDGRDGYPSFISTETFNMAIEALKREPCEDAISRLEAIKIVNNPLNIKLDLMLLRLPSVNPIPPKVVVDTCTDAVSREDIKKFVESFIHEIITESGMDKNAHTNEVLREVARGVGDIPPVTPERPKGEWIECMPLGAEEWCYKCSECNFWKYTKSIDLSKFKYCPNCGADMRGVSR